MAGFQYAGINLPVSTEYISMKDAEPIYPIGLPDARAANSDILPIREVAMMMLMDNLTDKPNWHEKVFDEAIVAKWRYEARTQSENSLFVRIMEGKWNPDGIPMPECRIISEAAFEFCIAELRNKAKYFIETGLIPTLDSAGNAIIKSDNLISDSLRDELVKAFETLRADQAANVDWHPRSNDMVQNLVHPSMYPFVYGRSKFLDEEQVGTKNALEFVGKGRVVPEIDKMADYGQRFLNAYWMRDRNVVPKEYRSNVYQWLPANVTFRDDGTTEFTSYINNLHPEKYPAIYEAIEHAIDAALPAWDQCLRENIGYKKNTVAGRSESRFELITEASDEEDHLWTRVMKFGVRDEDEYEVENEDEDEDEDEPRYVRIRAFDWQRYHAFRKIYASVGPRLVPGEWLKGREAILPEPEEFEEIDYSPKRRLRKMFKEHGLQVIVKMASIELTPEKPHFPTGSWHVEGQTNEKICATALFYLDSENVTDSHLSFRMQTSSYLRDDISTGQDQYNYLERVYGTGLGQYQASCLQTYGDVKTPQGRLLAFPNVLLKDATKPGHRRFLALWLVDPHERVVSTANVPPQQRDWWTDGQNEVPESLMTAEEAQEHRLKLMDERSTHVVEVERSLQRAMYNFCEH
ncbi:hypothetical protein TASIC1_0012016100 [Trichoderma asperellum]|uniref:Uncharacterized protein n=1 Tax=Trichoderma asperellum TaxID=101201 RepID=A0A6V8R828_TRIAP|nr:hypothetical protein TASIC1_0012016100 [Trichoderma asperellum]